MGVQLLMISLSLAALIDHSVHLTDLVRHLTGREVTSVAAETGALRWREAPPEHRDPALGAR